jgi:hypothetical protein
VAPVCGAMLSIHAQIGLARFSMYVAAGHRSSASCGLCPAWGQWVFDSTRLLDTRLVGELGPNETARTG